MGEDVPASDDADHSGFPVKKPQKRRHATNEHPSTDRNSVNRPESHFQHACSLMTGGHQQRQTLAEYPAMGFQCQTWGVVVLREVSMLREWST